MCIFGVVMGQGDAVGRVDAEFETRRNGGGIFLHGFSLGQVHDISLEQGPEPLISFPCGIMRAVFLQVIDVLMLGIDRSPPGILSLAAGVPVFPNTFDEEASTVADG